MERAMPSKPCRRSWQQDAQCNAHVDVALMRKFHRYLTPISICLGPLSYTATLFKQPCARPDRRARKLQRKSTVAAKSKFMFRLCNTARKGNIHENPVR
jgi:hypothetical protein